MHRILQSVRSALPESFLAVNEDTFYSMNRDAAAVDRCDHVHQRQPPPSCLTLYVLSIGPVTVNITNRKQ